MPLLDGYETTMRIRKEEKATGNRVPIVAMTAHAMKVHKDKCREAGMDYYLSKPIKAEEVIALIEQITREHKKTAA